MSNTWRRPPARGVGATAMGRPPEEGWRNFRCLFYNRLFIESCVRALPGA